MSNETQSPNLKPYGASEASPTGYRRRAIIGWLLLVAGFVLVWPPWIGATLTTWVPWIELRAVGFSNGLVFVAFVVTAAGFLMIPQRRSIWAGIAFVLAGLALITSLLSFAGAMDRYVSRSVRDGVHVPGE